MSFGGIQVVCALRELFEVRVPDLVLDSRQGHIAFSPVGVGMVALDTTSDFVDGLQLKVEVPAHSVVSSPPPAHESSERFRLWTKTTDLMMASEPIPFRNVRSDWMNLRCQIAPSPYPLH